MGSKFDKNHTQLVGDFFMQLKLTLKLKTGNKIEILKRLSPTPKGTDIDTHYLLEAHELVERISHNGLHLTISPAQIDNVFIQPKGDEKYEQSSMQDTRLHTASIGSTL